MRILILMLFCLPACAEDFYVSQNSAGADDGTSCANAKSRAWFSDGDNWGVGAGKISAGDTVRFCGTWTNSATVLGSGSAGNPITIRFESGASFILSIQTATIGINCGTYDYLVIDGNGGYITWTNSGSFMVASNTGAVGVSVAATTGHVTVQNIVVSNAYVFQRGSASTNLLTANDSVHSAGVQLSAAGVDLVVSNATFYYCEKGVSFSYSPGKSHGNVRLLNLFATNCAWTAGGGDTSAGAVCDGLILSNWTNTGSSNWESSDNGYHLNGCYFWAQQGSGNYLTNVIVCAGTLPDLRDLNRTAGIFFSASGGARILNPLVVNNVIAHTETLSNGAIKMWRCSGGGILHNTLDGVATGVQLTASTNIVMTNNLVKGYDYPIYTPEADGSHYQFSGVDYNWYYETISPRYWALSMVTWGLWQGAGYDVNGATNQNPLFVNSATRDYRLQDSSPAILAGPNTYTLVKTDRLGYARPSSGNSTIGAFEQTPAASVPAPAISLTGRQTWGGRVTFSQ